MNHSLENFTKQIETILRTVSTQKADAEIESNLIVSLYLEIVKNLSLDLMNKELIVELAGKNPKTTKDFEDAFNFFSDKSRKLGINTDSEINRAGKIILKNFIKELKFSLPPDKVKQLDKLIED